MRHTFIVLLLWALGCTVVQAQRATLRIDAGQKHQQITGFGAFVCSPQFTYNHMTATEVNKVWGKGSTVGLNIMRLYIPVGRNAWSQSLATAQYAKQKGLIVFASPWGQPAEWKTNGTINAKNSDGTTGKLKRENWADYAQYLEDYVQYLRTNGVELDAISIQNEPDWPAQYAGCLWDASEIAEFVKTYGRSISCKIMAPETLAVSDAYANALNKTDVLDCFDIYGGHQYGGIQSAYKNLGKKGKELWMTEYLINWNENQATERNFDFSKDFFNFFTSINTCMLGDFNAWIHYAAKRYYGPLGDGQRGTTTGVVTKRGYIMGHFARYVIGMTRIDAIASGASIESSAYLSQTGDTVAVVLANTSDESLALTLDLPFYTKSGKHYTTSKTKNLSVVSLTFQEESCRPVVNIDAQSVATLLFFRSRDRQPSNMTGTATRFDRLDDMAVTKTTFGTTYKMSGKTKTFDHNNALISTRTNTTYGYVALNDRFTSLVMHVKKVTSTMNYTSAKTTLLYVNAKGAVASHDYGTVDFSRRENFDIVFDLSPATLPDGCIGLIGMTNDNWSSTLSITFGDVMLGSCYAGKLTGAYVADDSYLLDFSTDPTCTSVNLTAVTDLPATLSWLEGTNKVAYVAASSQTAGDNVVVGENCSRLSLADAYGSFRPDQTFTAVNASLTLSDVRGMRLVMVPFQASVPEGVSAYRLDADLKLLPVAEIPAHQPVVVEAQGSVVFSGSGVVGYATSPLGDMVRGTYTSGTLLAGDYVVAQQNGQWGLKRLAANDVLSPFDAYVSLSSTDDFLPFDLSATAIEEVKNGWNAFLEEGATFNLMGQKVNGSQRGVLIRNHKIMIRR